jgi:hypothetical protein
MLTWNRSCRAMQNLSSQARALHEKINATQEYKTRCIQQHQHSQLLCASDLQSVSCEASTFEHDSMKRHQEAQNAHCFNQSSIPIWALRGMVKLHSTHRYMIALTEVRAAPHYIHLHNIFPDQERARISSVSPLYDPSIWSSWRGQSSKRNRAENVRTATRVCPQLPPPKRDN